MKDYTINFPAHQSHNWVIEVYCYDPADDWYTILDQSTASEVTEWLCWHMDNEPWIKKIDVWFDNRRWWGEMRRNVS